MVSGTGDYISRERIEKFFDGIHDCADLTFEPNDHCFAADDCAHCKWSETMNAIKKRILSIPAANVRPVVLCGVCELHGHCYTEDVFAFARLADGNRFCAVGKAKTNGEGRMEES